MVFLSLNMMNVNTTLAFVQFLYILQNWSHFLTCVELRSGLFIACWLWSWNLSYKPHLTVLRLVFMQRSSAKTSAALRKGCTVIALSIAVSLLWVMQLGQQCFQLCCLIEQLWWFADRCFADSAIADYDRFIFAKATRADCFFSVKSENFACDIVNFWPKLLNIYLAELSRSSHKTRWNKDILCNIVCLK